MRQHECAHHVEAMAMWSQPAAGQWWLQAGASLRVRQCSQRAGPVCGDCTHAEPLEAHPKHDGAGVQLGLQVGDDLLFLLACDGIANLWAATSQPQASGLGSGRPNQLARLQLL